MDANDSVTTIASYIPARDLIRHSYRPVLFVSGYGFAGGSESSTKQVAA